ncbi:adenosine deaminase [Microbacterium endophyticum]|uniref:Adenine deaminase n=1 Tax=Microbacterium endophyticum TaxID=1526412 RepID=A0A7W4V292_9MICO|nr:adenosine deaminase [Microbacterium endophyticum]MBB2975480.1 adenosine deaminase [Microbacterium endophyticum]NIK35501.1 adenosine deaminase [Microbacterium endophyticum]
MARTLAALPKAELHIHVEGTLEPDLAFEIAQRNGISLPYRSPDELRDAYDFVDLQSFLDVYFVAGGALRTPRDFHDLAWAYLERAHRDAVAHVELFFDPQAHLARGIALDEIVGGLSAALAEARETWDMSGSLIACFLRDRPAADAMAVLEEIIELDSPDIVGVGLDSTEVGYPPALFRDVFARAFEAGLHRVSHAGEEAPHTYIVEALDALRIERVDHGVRAIDSPELIERLARDGVALTMCPLSNKRLHVTPDLRDHPIRALVDQGVKVTINSDDPSYFGGYIADNYAAVREVLGLTDDEAAQFARTSIDVSFAPPVRKAQLHALVDGWLADEG